MARKYTKKELKTLGGIIMKLRRDVYGGHGGTKACAEAFGVTAKHWSTWETGKNAPSTHNLQKLARFFGVSMSHFSVDAKGGHFSTNAYAQIRGNQGGVVMVGFEWLKEKYSEECRAIVPYEEMSADQRLLYESTMATISAIQMLEKTLRGKE